MIGRSITLTEVILSSSFQWIMSMPLTWMPLMSATNSSTAEWSVPLLDVLEVGVGARTIREKLSIVRRGVRG